jgi:multidrug transporter EmrE-like cation transporter
MRMYLWLMLSVMLNVLGEYYCKLWANRPAWALALVACVLYGLSGITWLPVLLHKNQISTMAVIWFLLAIIFTFLLGTVYFHEKVNGFNVAGVLLAIVAVVFLSM